MKVLVINGSPKGKNSVTLHTALFLEKVFSKDAFSYIHAGQKINKYEKDMSELTEAMNRAETIVFAYPVYTFTVPYQLAKLIELMDENGITLEGKTVTQISTSMHFYDTTAHRYMEDCAHSLGADYIRGISLDMGGLSSEKGREQLKNFWKRVRFLHEEKLFEPKKEKDVFNSPVFSADYENAEKDRKYRVCIVAASLEGNIPGMVNEFKNAFPYRCDVIDLSKEKITGGCLGCLECAAAGECIYRDGFQKLLRKTIQTADMTIYAASIKNHSMGSRMKLFDDRQFCNGHRTVTMGKPVAYILSGRFSREENLRTVIDARAHAGGNFLAGIATDEGDTGKELLALAKKCSFALENASSEPQNFYGVGGMKIFRDMIYVMRGFMKEDHRFYRQNKLYDFPQKQKKEIIMMQFAGLAMSSKKIREKMKGKIGEVMLAPHKKALEEARPEE